MAFRLSVCFLTVSAFGLLKKLMKQFFTVQKQRRNGIRFQNHGDALCRQPKAAEWRLV